MVNPDKSNKLFQLAADLINRSSRNIFLTGKAGTGKTTFLKYIKETCNKQMAVVAPTGVAAINAGGVTIHSFFQLPFAPYIPGASKYSSDSEEVVNRNSLLSRLRITTERKKVLNQLELLIIDEVSMVRCDTMDAIDAVLRYIRKRPHERFGGLQVLFIGDMLQLPPVIKEPEWRILSEYYNGPYFFDSQVIREELPLYIEFDKIYRQSEETFIRLLNQVRNNEVDEDSMKILESRYKPSFERHSQDGYIVLTTHNEKARQINTLELDKLTGLPYLFKADIKDEFPESAHPADDMLVLKRGAQVMFIKNDSEKGKRFFNGKIGIVSEVEENKIVVQCDDDDEPIEVKPETWSNIRYSVDGSTRDMKEETIGSFTQYPLRLAWAITIHKSQGLTFEKAIIDAGDAFAAGQVYVALSRCTNLEGMILKSRVRKGSLFTDNRIVQFGHNCQSSDQLEREFASARHDFQAKQLISLFEFNPAINIANDLADYIVKNASSFSDNAISWLDGVIAQLNQLQATAGKFHLWMNAQFLQPVLPEENTVLLTKVKDGAIHFTKEIKDIIAVLTQSPVVTDSRLHAKEFNESIRELFAELSLKAWLLKDFNGKMDNEEWQKKKKEYTTPHFSINAYSGSGAQKIDSPHPQLLQQLRKVRDSICARKDIPIYLVANSKSLNEMVEFLPHLPEELEQITGFGKIRVESYGKEFLTIIQQYCNEKGLTSLIANKVSKGKTKEPSIDKQKKEKKQPALKKDTKAESYRLYREGMAIPEIAKQRNFTVQTIEGHLAHYIQIGDIKIEELLNNDKLRMIEPYLNDYTEGTPLTPIKEKLGNDISYGELRLAIAWHQYINSLNYDKDHI